MGGSRPRLPGLVPQRLNPDVLARYTYHTPPLFLCLDPVSKIVFIALTKLRFVTIAPIISFASKATSRFSVYGNIQTYQDMFEGSGGRRNATRAARMRVLYTSRHFNLSSINAFHYIVYLQGIGHQSRRRYSEHCIPPATTYTRISNTSECAVHFASEQSPKART
jgi:hypothetical protein